jgi:methionyl-tRNA formyltransferase
MTPLKQFPRIVFFGTPDFAVASLRAMVENGFNVVAVVTAPDKPAGRGMQLRPSAVKVYAEEQQIPLLQPEKLKDPQFLEALAALKADVQVVVAFRMLPQVVWSMPAHGTINVHGSLLPEYRGAAPINWAIMNGATQTGVTTFRLQHEIDMGNILMQQAVPIEADDDFGTMYTKLMEEGASLLLKTLDALIEGSLQEQEQKMEGTVPHAPKLFREHQMIQWQQPARSIHNQIRGLAPVPAAFTQLEGKQMKIFKSCFELTEHGADPGTWNSDGKHYLRFAAADGWLYALDVQYEGKKRMPITDFLRGFRLPV